MATHISTYLNGQRPHIGHRKLILPIIFVMTGLEASSDMGVPIAINRRAADVADLAPHVHPVVCT